MRRLICALPPRLGSALMDSSSLACKVPPEPLASAARSFASGLWTSEAPDLSVMQRNHREDDSGDVSLRDVGNREQQAAFGRREGKERWRRVLNPPTFVHPGGTGGARNESPRRRWNGGGNNVSQGLRRQHQREEGQGQRRLREDGEGWMARNDSSRRIAFVGAPGPSIPAEHPALAFRARPPQPSQHPGVAGTPSLGVTLDEYDDEERRDTRRKAKQPERTAREQYKDRRPAAPLSSRHSAKLFYRKKETGRAQEAPPKSDERRQKNEEKAFVPRQVVVPDQVSVRELASLLEMEPERLEQVLSELGEPVKSLEDILQFDTAELACLETNAIAIRDGREGEGGEGSEQRPAVVAVMGHVDHGKTSLLDALRKTSVAAGEAGGITQHIGAFEVSLPESGTSLTFLDTPGHAAFSAMRARGAAITDIVILVVAADDSVMPQTLEAISHARAAKCPIVVALSKVDLPSSDPERVKRDLASHGLELEEHGGDVQVVEVAAPKGLGLRDLEEALLLQAELLSLKSSRTANLAGTVVEARLEKGQGPVATVIVKQGSLRVGAPIVVGCQWGRVRALRAPDGDMVQEVGPGRPVLVAGLRGVPEAGDEVMQVATEERARRVSLARAEREHDYRLARLARTAGAARQQAEAEARTRTLKAQKAAAKGSRRKLRALMGAPGTEHKMLPDDVEGGEDGHEDTTVLPLVIKADVYGSIEAVEQALEALSSSKAAVQVVHAGVGPVSGSDVALASITGAKILAFNVRPDSNAVQKDAKQAGVDIMQYRVIYHLLEELGGLLAGLAPRIQVETVTGQAQVLQLFEVTGKKRGSESITVIAGCKVTQGSIHWRVSKAYRVLRGGEVVHEGLVGSLRKEKSETQEVGEGSECGVILEDFNDYVIGDVLQCVCIEERAPKTEMVEGGGIRVVEDDRSH